MRHAEWIPFAVVFVVVAWALAGAAWSLRARRRDRIETMAPWPSATGWRLRCEYSAQQSRRRRGLG